MSEDYTEEEIEVMQQTADRFTTTAMMMHEEISEEFETPLTAVVDGELYFSGPLLSMYITLINEALDHHVIEDVESIACVIMASVALLVDGRTTDIRRAIAEERGDD